MSFDATRAVWAARDAGALEGGASLLVALALADRADRRTGELLAGTRGLAARLALSHTTVTAALRDLQKAGALEVVVKGRGKRPTLWKWTLEPPPLRANPVTLDPVDNSDLAYQSGNARNPSVTDFGFSVTDPGSSVTAAVTKPGINQLEPELAARVTYTEAEPIALAADVRTRLAVAAGDVRNPAALRASVGRRLAQSHGGLVTELAGEPAPKIAVAILTADRLPRECPARRCNAGDAHPITDRAKCPRHEQCPYYVAATCETLPGHRDGLRPSLTNGSRPPVPDLDDGWTS